MLFARYSLRSLLPLLFFLGLVSPSAAQTFPFTSGPIPMCDTSTFTANVSGVGTLIIPDGFSAGYYIQSLMMNITTDHPQTLQVSLTSPAGTTLLLSAFNGAGGQNYTNTEFNYWSWTSITTGSAPFTGQFQPQGGSFDVFAWENADGPWVITVVDTACANGGTGPGGNWTPGWFDGGAGGGAFAFGFDSGGTGNTCTVDMGTASGSLCYPGETVNIMDYFQTTWGDPEGISLTASFVDPPYDVGSEGEYYIEGQGYSMWGEMCYYYGTFYVIQSAPAALGPDTVIDQCASTAAPVMLPYLFDWGYSSLSWTLDGQPIANSQAFNATEPGVYRLVATPNSGCLADTAYVTLNVHPDPALGADQLVSICSGGTADLSALFDTTGLSAAWTFSGAPVSDPTAAMDTGMYTLVATSPGGCSDTANVTLMVANAPPSLGADQTVVVCENSDIDLTGLFATPGMTQEWTMGGLAVQDPTAVSAAGTYQLVASTASACADTALVTVSVNAAPDLGSDSSAAICEGGTADLTGLFSTASLTTAWYLNGLAVTASNAVNSAGLYTLVATNTNGCSDTVAVQLTVAPTPELGPDQSLARCAGETVDLPALYPVATGSAAWTLNGAAVADPGAVGVTGSYLLVVTSAAGCSDTAAVNLQFNATPTLGADQAVTICAGESYALGTLFNTAGLTAVWSLGNVPVNDPAAVHTSGNYQLVVTNAFNCSDMAMLNLWVSTPPSLGPDQVLNICPWQIVDLTAAFPVSGTSVTYTLNGQAVPDPTNVTEAGMYTITSVDATGCSDEAMATVIPVECLCEADFVEDAHCLQEPVRFIVHADSTVLAAHWDFHGAAQNVSAQDAVVRFNEAGRMQVTLHATLSCGEVTVDRIVSVPDCSDSCGLFIPSAYTPNGDGVNDGWSWQGECVPEDYSMTVFDRWGSVVFSSTDPYKAWDGTANGKELTPGVYAFRVSYRLLYQDAKEEVGTITLIR